ncbi:DUF5615 family PIN-like protein [[Scytonema hofmanni] UTEX B 1581]|nr:DUF5615 family PIN-like protein [[Scytonema hofmanni] UTEX B 1581]
MARLYTDENFPLPVVELLRAFGHDILTARKSGILKIGTSLYR